MCVVCAVLCAVLCICLSLCHFPPNFHCAKKLDIRSVQHATKSVGCERVCMGLICFGERERVCVFDWCDGDVEVCVEKKFCPLHRNFHGGDMMVVIMHTCTKFCVQME